MTHRSNTSNPVDFPTPPSCGDTECSDGYRVEPPLQDGGACAVYPCPACKRLADTFWQRYAERGQG